MNSEDITKNTNEERKSPLFGQQHSDLTHFDDLLRYTKLGKPAVSQIRVRLKGVIDSIDFVYQGQSFKHGGYGGDEIVFDLKVGEYVTKVEGKLYDYEDERRIAALTFHLNSGNKFEAIGVNKNFLPFEFSANTGGAISCLFGNAGKYLNQIGFYDIPRIRNEAIPVTLE